MQPQKELETEQTDKQIRVQNMDSSENQTVDISNNYYILLSTFL